MAMLEVRDLHVQFRTDDGLVKAVDGVSFILERGRTLGIVGESGSGKSVTSLGILGLHHGTSARISGKIWLDGEELVDASPERVRELRGSKMAMIFQDPLSSLHPYYTVGHQIEEAYLIHNKVGKKAARARAVDLLGRVGIPQPSARVDDYPHQFSGGMRQRAMIAMALACSPKLLIADEPTTGLDPLVARQIMALIARLRREHDMGVLFVTHDLSVVEEHADSIHVLYAGSSVESGPSRAFFAHPRHPYSEALLGSVARLGQARLQSIHGQLPEPENRPQGCRFAPRCDYRRPECEISYPHLDESGGTAAACLFPLPVKARPDIFNATDRGIPVARKPQLEISGLTVNYAAARFWFGGNKTFTALNDITLALGQGECLGVVGESGSGKSTLGRAILQMIAYQGRIALDGRDFAPLTRAERRLQRRRIQVVFQDPRESLNPRMRIRDIIAEPIRLAGNADAEKLPARIAALLQRVGLNRQIGESLPGAVSGGQAQRIAIARALAAEPDILVLDEPTSALDVSTQAMLLNLLKDLAAQTRLSYILISHDFAVVSYMADRIAVLNAGRVLEVNTAGAIIANPQSDYTRALVEAAPRLRMREIPAQGARE